MECLRVKQFIELVKEWNTIANHAEVVSALVKNQYNNLSVFVLSDGTLVMMEAGADHTGAVMTDDSGGGLFIEYYMQYTETDEFIDAGMPDIVPAFLLHTESIQLFISTNESFDKCVMGLNVMCCPGEKQLNAIDTLIKAILFRFELNHITLVIESNPNPTETYDEERDVLFDGDVKSIYDAKGLFLRFKKCPMYG